MLKLIFVNKTYHKGKKVHAVPDYQIEDFIANLKDGETYHYSNSLLFDALRTAIAEDTLNHDVKFYYEDEDNEIIVNEYGACHDIPQDMTKNYSYCERILTAALEKRRKKKN